MPLTKVQWVWLACPVLWSTHGAEAFQPAGRNPFPSLLLRRLGNPSSTTLYSTEANNEECSLDEDGEALNECLVNEGYVNEDENEELVITKVYKAKLESLRDRFESR